MATVEIVEKLRDRANVTYEEAREALDASGDDLLDALIWLEKKGKVPPPRVGSYTTDGNSDQSGVYGDHGFGDTDHYYDSKHARSQRKNKRDRVAGPGGKRCDARYANQYEDCCRQDSRNRSQKRRHSRSRGDAYYDNGYNYYGRASSFWRSLAQLFRKAFHIGNTTMVEVSRHEQEIIRFPLTIMVVAFIVLFNVVIILIPVSLFFGFRYKLSGGSFNEKPVNSAMDSAARAVDGIKDTINKNKRG